jgi:hypothetical protein
MNQPEGRIPPLKKLAAQIAKLLPPSWRFPICGVSASVSGREATRPIDPATFPLPDTNFLRPVADFLEPGHLSPLALVQSHLVSVPNGIAWSRGAHLTGDGRLIDPLSVGMSMSMDRWLIKRQRFFPNVRHVPGTVISLSTDGHNNYYHWMLDLLPKFFIALAAGFDESTFYLGASTPFQKETLQLLGIPVARVLDCNAIPFLQADEMIVPFLGQRHPPNVFDAAKCRLLQETFSFLIAGKQISQSLPTRFVVSRAKNRSRRVINEPDLLARLRPLGFESVYLEDLTLVEQIALFAKADAIVASTGAGLVNLIHARPGTALAILMPEECPDVVCQEIAEFAQLRSKIFYAERYPVGTPDKIGCDIKLNEILLTDVLNHLKA